MHGEIKDADLDALERFVAENDELLAIEAMIGRFNVFDALRVTRAEVRHSNFLAWLLDPAESHGHGDLFLKAILMDMLRRTPAGMRPLSPVALDGSELADVTVRREWPGKIDVCIACRSPAFVLAIENKVDSGEHSDQLRRYGEVLTGQFGGVGHLKVFLTRTGEEPSDPTWVPYSYADIHLVLTRLRRMPGGALGGDVGTFLDHYLNLIESQFMDNPELVDLCRRIYSNHRRAIDLINTHAAVAGSEALSPISEWLQKRPSEWVIRKNLPKRVSFVPKPWVGRVSLNDGQPKPDAVCDMYLECERWERNNDIYVSARLVVGPALRQELRQQVITRLKSQPYALVMQREKAAERWTRLSSETFAKWAEDDEIPSETLVSGFAAWIEKLGPALVDIPKLLEMVARDSKAQ